MAEIYEQSTGGIEKLSDETKRILHRHLAENEHPSISRNLRNRHWRLLVAPNAEIHFVIGDEPVVVHDRSGKVRTGLKFPTSQISVPLSPNVVLQGCYSEIRQEVLELTPLATRQLNGRFVRNAFAEAFASQNNFEWLHQAGKIFTASDWMTGIPEATWPSNPKPTVS